MRNAASLSAEPDLRDWVDRVAINPARVPPDQPGSPALDAVRAAVGERTGPGLARLSELMV